ncbi:tripartite motif-containing protein 16-like protein isoform X1 [Alosa pseudoharengus]|uniref:tripartite motif-containing protein 16-like protein isoform X1 n=1 Tax=Alosa pseudoharengus TaxID=34774 RepID=UPI003F8C6356
MAQANVLWTQDQFSCPVCLELLKDPVTINCGHSFCRDCISNCWDQEEVKGVYSCPQCRQTFTPRPVLGRNTMLAEVVDKLKIMGLQAIPPAQCYAGPGDVECDVCTGKKCKAVKSCLVCLASYCGTHLKLHNDLNPGNHRVINAIRKMQDIICFHHDKLLEVFCRTEEKCICVLCAMDEHSGHNMVSASTERAVKEKQIPEAQRKSQQIILAKEGEFLKLRSVLKNIKTSAQAAVDDCETTFREMISAIERRRFELIKLIRDQERAEVIRGEELLEQLDQEIAGLKKRDAELEQLPHTDNHIHFLQSFLSLRANTNSEVSSRPTVLLNMSFQEVKDSVSELKKRFVNLLQKDLASLSKHVRDVKIFLPNEPKTREEFLKYSSHFTMDSNTSHPSLILENNNRVVSRNLSLQTYPDHAERFNSWQQVLCKETVSERSYWEVEWSGQSVNIAVSYKDIDRKGWGDETLFGCNDQSWCLSCSASNYFFRYNGEETILPSTPGSSRIGVFLDYKAGVLSFYAVSDIMTLLHTVQATFSKPIYPGFWLDTESKVTFCK